MSKLNARKNSSYSCFASEEPHFSAYPWRSAVLNICCWLSVGKVSYWRIYLLLRRSSQLLSDVCSEECIWAIMPSLRWIYVGIKKFSQWRARQPIKDLAITLCCFVPIVKFSCRAVVGMWPLRVAATDEIYLSIHWSCYIADARELQLNAADVLNLLLEGKCFVDWLQKGTDSLQTHKIAAVGSVSFRSQVTFYLFSPLWRLCSKLITNYRNCKVAPILFQMFDILLS
jgi:hypothetical protein